MTDIRLNSPPKTENSESILPSRGFRRLSPDDTPLEAGLGFAIDWNKPFLGRGREALLVQKKATGVQQDQVQRANRCLQAWFTESFRVATLTGIRKRFLQKVKTSPNVAKSQWNQGFCAWL